MRISVPGRISRAASVVALAGVAVALVASSALAATQTSHSGTIGSVKFSDSDTHPGATCTYQGAAGSLYFSGVQVKGPKVMWPNTSAGADHGWVAFRVQIQHFDGATWSVVKQSSPTKMAVSDSAWTSFAAKNLSWPGPNSHIYRASVSLKWITAGGSTEGRATYVLDHQRRGYDNSVGTACVGRHPNLG